MFTKINQNLTIQSTCSRNETDSHHPQYVLTNLSHRIKVTHFLQKTLISDVKICSFFFSNAQMYKRPMIPWNVIFDSTLKVHLHKNLIQFRSDHARREKKSRISLRGALHVLTPANHSLFCHRLLHHFPTKISCNKSIVRIQGVHVSYIIMNMYVHGTLLILKSNEATANAV